MPESEEDHASPLRSLMSLASGTPYVSFKSLDLARSDPEGLVILEGDEGGMVYLVFPATEVVCSEEVLGTLLRDIDELAWPGNDPSMAHMVFERRSRPETVAGGMGGGVVRSSGWVHPKLGAMGIEPEIRSVVGGSRTRLTEATRTLRRR